MEIRSLFDNNNGKQVKKIADSKNVKNLADKLRKALKDSEEDAVDVAIETLQDESNVDAIAAVVEVLTEVKNDLKEEEGGEVEVDAEILDARKRLEMRRKRAIRDARMRRAMARRNEMIRDARVRRPMRSLRVRDSRVLEPTRRPMRQAVRDGRLVRRPLRRY
jgi:hypothetical protein